MIYKNMADKSEKILNSRLAWQGGFLKVVQDEVVLSNGAKRRREYIRHPGAALVIPMLDEQTVLMVRQWRHPLQKEFLEFPAGKIDPGEDMAVTANRELTEETGHIAGELRYLTTIHPVIGYADERIGIYLGRDLKPQVAAHTDPNEILSVEKVKISDLYQMTRNEQLTDVKTQIAVFWLEKVLKEGW